MTIYRYKGVNARGRLCSGRIGAANASDLELRLRKMGLEPIRYRKTWSVSGSLLRPRVRQRDLIMFCFHLEQALRAGVSVLDSLQDLRNSADHPRMREVSASMLESIEGGKTLSEAMREHTGVFGEVFVSLIHAGEQTGALGDILEKLGANLKWQDEQAAIARKLIIAPALTGAVVGAVAIFLMVYLAPELLKFVLTTSSELPAHTLLLIAVSNGFADYLYVILSAPLLGAAVVVIGARTSPGFRLLSDRFRLALPVVGPIRKKLILARLAGLFAIMYASGITVLDCVSAGERSAGNLAIARAMNSIGRAIADGNSLADSFAASGLFPPLILRMIQVGETTGALAPALENIAYFYTRDAREATGRLQSMTEPLMTILLGLVIGWVMVSVLGPIYDLITGLSI